MEAMRSELKEKDAEIQEHANRQTDIDNMTVMLSEKTRETGHLKLKAEMAEENRTKAENAKIEVEAQLDKVKSQLTEVEIKAKAKQTQ